MSTMTGSFTFPGSVPLGSAKSVFVTQFRNTLAARFTYVGPESITVTSILAGSTGSIVVKYSIRVSTSRSVSTSAAITALAPSSVVVGGIAAETISEITTTDDVTDTVEDKPDTTMVVVILGVFAVVLVLMLLSICWCWRKGGCANPHTVQTVQAQQMQPPAQPMQQVYHQQQQPYNQPMQVAQPVMRMQGQMPGAMPLAMPVAQATAAQPVAPAPVYH